MIWFVEQISHTVPVENSIRIKTRSVMGTEIPLVEFDKSGNIPTYAYYSTKMSLDLNKRQAQYLALQNQINPHFLYNTLESIRG